MAFRLPPLEGEPQYPTAVPTYVSLSKSPASWASSDDTAVYTSPAYQNDESDETDEGHESHESDGSYESDESHETHDSEMSEEMHLHFLGHPEVYAAVYTLLYYQYTGANLQTPTTLRLVRKLYPGLPAIEAGGEHLCGDERNAYRILCCFRVFDRISGDVGIKPIRTKSHRLWQNFDYLRTLCYDEVDWQWRKYVQFEDREEDLSDPIWRMFKGSPCHDGYLWQKAREELRDGLEKYLDTYRL